MKFVIMLLLLVSLTGCFEGDTVYASQWRKGEEVCAVNGGLALIYTTSVIYLVNIVCNNKAVFHNVRVNP